MRPSETVAILERTGFGQIEVTDTGEKYLQAYNRVMDMAARGETPVLGTHILLGKLAPEIVRNAARNIVEKRTHPVQILCRKPV